MSFDSISNSDSPNYFASPYFSKAEEVEEISKGIGQAFNSLKREFSDFETSSKRRRHEEVHSSLLVLKINQDTSYLELFDFCLANPGYVPIIKHQYPEKIQEIFKHIPKQKLLGAEQLIMDLIWNGAQIDIEFDGTTPFKNFCELGLNRVVDLILKKTPSNLSLKQLPEFYCKGLEEAIKQNQFAVLEIFFNHELLTNQKTSDGITLIELAYLNNQTKMILLFLESGVSVNTRLSSGATLLGQAFIDENYDLAKLLLRDWNADPNICFRVSTTQGTALHACVESDDEDLLTLAIARGAYINAPNNERFTPLALALAYNKASMVLRLLQRGADPLLAKGNELLLFFMLVESGELAMLKSLLTFPIYRDFCNAQNSSGNTPLMQAVSSGHNDMAHYFLEKGVELTTKNHDGDNLLHLLAREEMYGLFALVLERIDASAIDSRNSIGNTPIMIGACFDDNKVIEPLFKKGASLLLTNNNGQSLLHLFARSGNFDMLSKVLPYFKTNPEAIDAPDKDGNTPLLLAGLCGDDESIELLMQQGGKLFYSNNQGRNLLHMLASQSTTAVLSKWASLFGQQALDSMDHQGNTPLLLAAKQKKPGCVKLLLELGANVNISNHEGETVFIHLVNQGNMQLAQEVLSKSLDPRKMINTSRLDGETALVHAISSGYPDMVQWLMDWGADLTLVNDEGKTLAHYIAESKNEIYFPFLKRLSPKEINAQDRKGNTPLMQALLSKNFRAVSLLLEHGADPTIGNNHLNSPFHALAALNAIEFSYMLFLFKSAIKDDNRFKAALNAKNRNGKTPLTSVVLKHPFQREVFNLLLEQGAEIEQIRIDHLPLLFYHPQLQAYKETVQKCFLSFTPLSDQDRKQKENGDRLMKRIPKIQAYGLLGTPSIRKKIKVRIESIHTMDQLDDTVAMINRWATQLNGYAQSQKTGALRLSPRRAAILRDSKTIQKLLLKSLAKIKKQEVMEPYSLLIAQDENGPQGIALLKRKKKTLFLELLATHPRNLPLKSSKHTVTGTGTALLKSVAQEALKTNKTKVQLQGTSSTSTWCAKAGFQCGGFNDWILEGEALRKLQNF